VDTDHAPNLTMTILYSNKTAFLFAVLLSALPDSAFSTSQAAYLLTDAQTTNITTNTQFGLSPFNYNIIHIDSIQFDINNQTISKSVFASETLLLPRTHTQAFTVQNWNNQYLPLLNGKPLRLTGKSLALSINENEKSFFLISDSEKILFSNSGNIIWKKKSSNIASHAIISPDNKYIVIKYQNGTIEWLNYENGETKFSLYIEPESLDWIIWSPEGYYNSSRPSFCPVALNLNNNNTVLLSQLQESHFRPDYIQSLISDSDGNDTLNTKTYTDTSKLIPPTISFISDNQVIDSTSIRACVKSAIDHPVDILLGLNDVTITRTHYQPSSQIRNNQCTYIVDIPRPELDGEKKSVSVRAFDSKDKLWSLKIEKTLFPVQKSLNDKTTKAITVNLLPKKYSGNNIIQTTLSSKEKSFKTSSERKISGPFIFYLSSECRIQNNDIKFSNNQSLNTLSSDFQKIRSDKSLIIIDCLINNNGNNKLAIKKIIDKFITETGRSLLAQFYTKDQLDKSRLKHSFFVETLLNASKGEADYNDDLSIDSNELKRYVAETLPVTAFEFTGENGIIFNHSNTAELFNLPLIIKD